MNAELSDTIEAVQRALGGLAVDGIAGPKTWAKIAWKIGGTPEEHAATGRDARATDQAGRLSYADERSERNIATLLPALQPIAREFVVRVNAAFRELENFTVAKIIDGSRTYAEQNKIYEIGRTRPNDEGEWKTVTKVRGGYSNHNFGLAFDFCLFDDRGNPLYDSPLYDMAGEIGKSLGLSWGGDWHDPVDRPHFELRPEWARELSEPYMMVELRRRAARGESLNLSIAQSLNERSVT